MKKIDNFPDYDLVANRSAKDVLNIDSLETQNSDSLDFFDISVWSIREALILAIKEGEKIGQKNQKKKFNSSAPSP